MNKDAFDAEGLDQQNREVNEGQDGGDQPHALQKTKSLHSNAGSNGGSKNPERAASPGNRRTHEYADGGHGGPSGSQANGETGHEQSKFNAPSSGDLPTKNNQSDSRHNNEDNDNNDDQQGDYPLQLQSRQSNDQRYDQGNDDQNDYDNRGNYGRRGESPDDRRDQNPDTYTQVYIAGIDRKTGLSDIKTEFSKWGKIERVILKDVYAFVNFESHESAVEAVEEMNNKRFVNGEVLAVEQSLPSKKGQQRQRETKRLGPGRDDKCYNCGGRGHWQNECKEEGNVGASGYGGGGRGERGEGDRSAGRDMRDGHRDRMGGNFDRGGDRGRYDGDGFHGRSDRFQDNRGHRGGRYHDDRRDEDGGRFHGGRRGGRFNRSRSPDDGRPAGSGRMGGSRRSRSRSKSQGRHQGGYDSHRGPPRDHQRRQYDGPGSYSRGNNMHEDGGADPMMRRNFSSRTAPEMHGGGDPPARRQDGGYRGGGEDGDRDEGRGQYGRSGRGGDMPPQRSYGGYNRDNDGDNRRGPGGMEGRGGRGGGDYQSRDMSGGARMNFREGGRGGFHDRGNRPNDGSCFKCGEMGHYAKDCPQAGGGGGPPGRGGDDGYRRGNRDHHEPRDRDAREPREPREAKEPRSPTYRLNRGGHRGGFDGGTYVSSGRGAARGGRGGMRGGFRD